MKYLGSKRRIAKEILPIILKNRQRNQHYVEPFCGGCNTIDKVENPRIANDSHTYLISFCKGLSKGWVPPKNISEKMYTAIKNNPAYFDSRLVGYVGFQLSFGAKWFGGYRRDKTGKRNYSREAYQNVIKQQPNLTGIKFYNMNYFDLPIPKNSIIYCDPPYENTTKYKDDFDHGRYWDWVRDMVKFGHKVFCSEYHAPEDFISVWSKKLITGVDVVSRKTDVENLFVHKTQVKILDKIN
jgi:DNA adenine methylase